MTTPTTNRQYAKPVVGADSSTWGTELNTIFDLIDKNLGTALSLSVAGNTDVTLSASQAANLSYNFTGALTGNINVVWPASEGGFFIVQNSTSGAFTLTVKVSGGTGAVIPQLAGAYTLIFSDATNMYALNTIGGLEVIGTAGKALTVSQTMTLTSPTSGSTLDIGAGLKLNQAGTTIAGDGSAHTVIDFSTLPVGMYAVHSYQVTGGNNWGAIVLGRGTGPAIVVQSSTTYSVSGANLQLTGSGSAVVHTYYSQLTSGT